MQQSNFKVSGLALYCFCGDTVEYGPLSLSKKKKCPKESNNMAVEKTSVSQ